MLSDLYHMIDSPEMQGNSITIPEASSNAIYLSRGGELFCYTGIYRRESDEVSFHSWPYYLQGKHTANCEKYIKGLFRVKNGCILLTGFVDHEFYNNKIYKHLENYIMRLPSVNNTYFGIEKRIETGNSWRFEENEELSRACFGLSYFELSYLVQMYAERLGIKNSFSQYPRITRSLKNDHYCEITGAWIPTGFPYITFNGNGYTFSHVSLFGFYRHVSALLSMGTNIFAAKESQQEQLSNEILNRVIEIDDYFPFEIIVTREYIVPDMYVK